MPGQRWLDLACGTGAVAERAAVRGARVTGIDLAPALIATARERAQARGLDIDYRVGDCETLDVPDGRFDAVSSTGGVMCSSDHEATARELARVTGYNGRIALAHWTAPSGPFDWGSEARVRELLGDWFELHFETHAREYLLVLGIRR